MSDSPYRLTAMTIASGLLAVAGFMSAGLHRVYASLPLLASGCALAVIGVIGMYWSASTLRDNVQNERWSADTLAPFRRVFDHPVWKWAMFLLLLLMLIALIAQDRHHRTYFWSVFFLLQTQSQISSAFRRPSKPSGHSARPDWSKISPLRSEHWGER